MIGEGTPNQVFLAKTYQDLLHRQIDSTGLAGWGALLTAGIPTTQVVLMIESSPEYRTVQVQGLYQHLLHRAADPFGLLNGVNFLMGGGTVEQLEIALANSPEYFQTRGGGTNSGFVTALYQDFLNRGIGGDNGAQGFITGLNQMTMSPAQVAAAVVLSPEGRLITVQGYYKQFLRRPLDPAGQSTWVGLLVSGVRDEAVIAGIMGSTEYFNRAV